MDTLESVLRDWVAYVERTVARYGAKALLSKEQEIFDRAKAALSKASGRAPTNKEE